MAEGFAQITEGTGKKLHTFERTIGTNTVQDEVVLNGEPYLASYTTGWATSSTTATVNSHLIQIMAGTTLNVRIRRILIRQAALATGVAFGFFGLYRLTTAGTGGTSQTPSPLQTSDAVSGAAVQTLPTVKGTEGVQLAAEAPILIQTLAASTPSDMRIVDWDFDLLRTKPLIIPSGAANGIAVKNLVAVAGASVGFNIWFDETNF